MTKGRRPARWALALVPLALVLAGCSSGGGGSGGTTTTSPDASLGSAGAKALLHPLVETFLLMRQAIGFAHDVTHGIAILLLAHAREHVTRGLQTFGSLAGIRLGLSL